MHAPDVKPSSFPTCQWGMASLSAEAGPQTRWLWQGYLATGAVTLLTSQWKTGKTTLMSVLLSRMKTGGSLAGLSVAAGRAVVVSEESAAVAGSIWKITSAGSAVPSPAVHARSNGTTCSTASPKSQPSAGCPW
jgi:hypothetical protein